MQLQSEKAIQRTANGSATDLFGDYWIKFSQYEIRNDRIRPTPGATMTRYEPWEAYGPPKGKETRGQPYHSLLILAGVAAKHSDNSDQFKDAVLNFAAEHGLLGMLLHRLETMVLPQETSGAVPGRPFGQTTYFRTVTGWQSDATHSDARNSSSGVFMRSAINGFKIELQPLEALCAKYFPNLEPAQLPLPFSEAFWTEYSEPLFDVWSTILQFYNTVNDARIKPAPRSGKEPRQLLAGLAALRELAAPVRPNLYRAKQRKLSLGWVCHSLLAAFAMMVTLDLAQNRLLRCARQDCRAYFSSQAKKAKYCSRKCRNVVQVRKFRRKNADKLKRLRLAEKEG